MECHFKSAKHRLQGQGTVYFLTATLRGETFYGVVNAWVLPEGQYGAFRGLNNEIYIMSHKSALNLSYQDRMPVTGHPECLMTLLGQDLIGTPLKVTSCTRPPDTSCPLSFWEYSFLPCVSKALREDIRT